MRASRCSATTGAAGTATAGLDRSSASGASGPFPIFPSYQERMSIAGVGFAPSLEPAMPIAEIAVLIVGVIALMAAAGWPLRA
jgi:hypothetical protein